ncbi:MAG: hypothetical protein AAF719_04655 [Pseudomonadota bacterium]
MTSPPQSPNVAAQSDYDAYDAARVTADDLLSFIKRRISEILIVATIVVVGVSAIIATSPLVYTSEALVLVERNRSPNLRSDLLPDAQLADVINTEALIARSRPVMQAAVAALDLPEPEHGRMARWGLKPMLAGDDHWLQEFSEDIVIRPVPDSNILSFSYVAEDPVFAASVSNAILDAYFKERLGIFKPSGESQIYADRADAAEAKIVELRAEQDDLLSQSGASAAADRKVGLVTERTALNDRLLNLRQTRRAQSEFYQDGHPEIRRIDGDIQDVRNRLSQIDNELGRIDRALRQSGRIEVELQAAEAEYLDVRRLMEQARLRETADGSLTNVRLVNRAAPPAAPSGSPIMTLALGVIFGLILGIAFALLREYFSEERS